MTTSNLKEYRSVIAMMLLGFSLLVASYIKSHNFYDLVYIIFIVICFVRYLLIVKDN